MALYLRASLSNLSSGLTAISISVGPFLLRPHLTNHLVDRPRFFTQLRKDTPNFRIDRGVAIEQGLELLPRFSVTPGNKSLSPRRDFGPRLWSVPWEETLEGHMPTVWGELIPEPGSCLDCRSYASSQAGSL